MFRTLFRLMLVVDVPFFTTSWLLTVYDAVLNTYTLILSILQLKTKKLKRIWLCAKEEGENMESHCSLLNFVLVRDIYAA